MAMQPPLTREIPGFPSWPGASRADSRPPAPRALITPQGERALRATLERLRHQLDVEFADRMREDRGFGEIAGNDEYLQTLEEAAVLEARISALEGRLRAATVVPASPAPRGLATIGSTVEVEDVSSGAVHEHRLIGDYEDLGPDVVSASSPVGQALMGGSPGDEVDVELPGGTRRTLRILAVRRAMAGARGQSRRT